MTDGGIGLTGEQISWLTVSREIEDRILQIFSTAGDGFYGKITIELHCKASIVDTYMIGTDRTYKANFEHRTPERRTAGPRDEG